MYRFWTVTNSGEGSHLICVLMFAFPEQLSAELEAIRELTPEFPNLCTAVNIKIRKRSGNEREHTCVCIWIDSQALDFKDKYYLGLFGNSVFERLNLLVGKSILNSNNYSRFLNFSWFEYLKSLIGWLVIQHK